MIIIFCSGTLDYIAARNRIDDTARLTADLIDYLYRKGFVRLENLHIVGHSLGFVVIVDVIYLNDYFLISFRAHAAGIAGKFVAAGLFRKVGAIYGLDPAGRKG